MKIIVWVIVASLALGACNNSKKSNGSNSSTAALEGTWELQYIKRAEMTFDSLFPGLKPTLSFDKANQRISGNSSCNSYAGPFTREGNRISFTGPIMMTKKMCAHGLEGENTFMDMLGNVTNYRLEADSILYFMMGEADIMRFHKK